MKPTPGIELLTREQMLARIEEHRLRVMAYNAACLRTCVGQCGNVLQRCAGCHLGNRITKIEDHKIYFEDGVIQALDGEPPS